MSTHHTTIHGLEQLKDAEQKTAIYYQSAATAAAEHNQEDHIAVFRSINEAHSEIALQLEARKEQLEKDAGEGLAAEILENVVDALKAFVADLPTFFLQRETEPTPRVLAGFEQELIEQYQQLGKHADEETKRLLDMACESSRKHIATLAALKV